MWSFGDVERGAGIVRPWQCVVPPSSGTVLSRKGDVESGHAVALCRSALLWRCTALAKASHCWGRVLPCDGNAWFRAGTGKVPRGYARAEHCGARALAQRSDGNAWQCQGEARHRIARAEQRLGNALRSVGEAWSCCGIELLCEAEAKLCGARA